VEGLSRFQVEVVRSTRRRKTVSARQVGDVLQISIPAGLSVEEESHWVGEMTRRFERRARTAPIDLADRAAVLAARFDLPEPGTIRWVGNQRNRWGSCSPGRGVIRISSRLAAFPSWVLDAVIVHELAHLLEDGHGPAFQALIARNPLQERAIGYLLAKGMDGDDLDEAGGT
jgi:predicted metal-dependent hydrolase